MFPIEMKHIGKSTSRSNQLPDALCGPMLMSEATSDKLFRDTMDTWLGPPYDDPLNDYDRYASEEESKGFLDKE